MLVFGLCSCGVVLQQPKVCIHTYVLPVTSCQLCTYNYTHIMYSRFNPPIFSTITLLDTSNVYLYYKLMLHYNEYVWLH